MILILISCLLLAGCTTPSGTSASQNNSPPPDNGFVLNKSVNPGDNFYGYVNDAWIAEHPVPADKASVSTFSVLGDKVDDDLHALFEKAANASPAHADRDMTLVGQFYRSGMDTASIDRDGITPLNNELAMIGAISSRADLTNATVTLLQRGSGPVYYYSAEINPRNTAEMVPGLWQGGLGLPDRDYYLRTDNKSVGIQAAYLGHITRVFGLAGETPSQAAADANVVYGMEKTLATAHFSTEENRDPAITTNLIALSTLREEYPAIGWDELSTIPGSGPVSVVNIHQPQFVKGLNTLLETAPLDDWKVYLKYQLINNDASYLSTPFETEDFAFYSTTLYGVTEMKPRWKRVVNTESALLSDPVGKEYVTEYVDPRTRGMASEIFANIRKTLDGRIGNLSWMGDATKKAAHEKLAAMTQKVGYPDQWMDYSGLALTGSYVENVRSASAYSFVYGPYGLDKIGKPIDKTRWDMSPQTVNAQYDPTKNEITFPAAILQPPFFDPDADSSLNYGGLGWIVGHEMTHGFDDQGRQYDKDGNLKDWWTPEDAKNFKDKTAVLVTEYNGFEVLPGLHINGNLTLGENIADFGGLTLAYHAWKTSLNQSAGTELSGAADRQFFFGAARTWQANYREDALRNQVYTDPHSTPKYRVNGVMFNVPEFYAAFPEVKPGDALYRNTSGRPVIW